MHGLKRFSALFGLFWILSSLGYSAESTYLNYNQLTQRLKALQKQHSAGVHLSELAVSSEKRTVWLLEISALSEKERPDHPAMLALAGVEGNHLVGTEVAVAFAERLCGTKEKTGEFQDLLKTTTIYIIPRLNPDGAERYFLTPRQEMETNTTPFDDDHDGLIDEDGPEDLNGDGVISLMRVEHPDGTYIEHPDDPRVLIKADPAKGERGKWLLLSEGKDHDGDKKIGEDPLGGVNFNHNFPYQYPWFDPQAGIYPICEKETRAMAEFMVSHPHIGIFMTFAANDNLLKTPASEDQTSGRDPQTKIRTEDVKYYDELGKIYRKLMGIEKPVESPSAKGSVADWIYFHRGRLSLCARVWSPEIALAMKKKEDKNAPAEKDAKTGASKIEAATKENESKKEKEDERGKTEIEYLKWLDQNAPGAFLPWREFKHPDYPGKKVEIGGLVPFADTLPPESVLKELMPGQVDFLTQLARKLPRIHFREVEAKPLGSGVYDLRILVENTGYLPTVLAHGVRAGVQADAIKPTRLEIDLPKEAFLSGARRTMLPPIPGGGNAEVHLVIQPKSKTQVKCEVISALAGRDERTVEFKKEGGR